jgi:hypothetical protein
MHQYDVDRIKEYTHLTYCESQKEVFQAIAKVLGGNSNMENTRNIFLHADTDNTRRIVEWMIKKKNHGGKSTHKNSIG